MSTSGLLESGNWEIDVNQAANEYTPYATLGSSLMMLALEQKEKIRILFQKGTWTLLPKFHHLKVTQVQSILLCFFIPNFKFLREQLWLTHLASNVQSPWPKGQDHLVNALLLQLHSYMLRPFLEKARAWLFELQYIGLGN